MFQREIDYESPGDLPYIVIMKIVLLRSLVFLGSMRERVKVADPVGKETWRAVSRDFHPTKNEGEKECVEAYIDAPVNSRVKKGRCKNRVEAYTVS